MKKQLVIKRKRQNFPIQFIDTFLAIKRINKNRVFFTDKCLILNPVGNFKDNFFIIRIEQSYKILIIKEEWSIPQYATIAIKKICDCLQLYNKIKEQKSGIVKSIKGKYIEYEIPFPVIIQNNESYYRMNFSSVLKETKQKIFNNQFIQVNGRQIKPIFENGKNKSFVSTSPVLQTSIELNNDKKTCMISKYSIDTKNGQITKEVIKAWSNNDTISDLTNIQSYILNQRNKILNKLEANVK